MTKDDLIVLNVPKADIPVELLKNEWGQKGFAHPFAQYDSVNMPKPPMHIRLTSFGLRAGSVYVTEEGDVCVYPFEFDNLCERSSGMESAIQIIQKDIETLPKLWQWALGIRREQDRMFAQICAMLPGWEIVGLTGRRFCFWRTGYHGYNAIKAWVDFLNNAGVSLTPPEEEINLDHVIGRLRGLWAQTEGQKEKRRKEQEEEKRESEENVKNQERERKERRGRALKLLKENGLLK